MVADAAWRNVRELPCCGWFSVWIHQSYSAEISRIPSVHEYDEISRSTAVRPWISDSWQGLGHPRPLFLVHEVPLVVFEALPVQVGTQSTEASICKKPQCSPLWSQWMAWFLLFECRLHTRKRLCLQRALRDLNTFSGRLSIFRSLDSMQSAQAA